MADLTEADVRSGQIWRDGGTPHRWRVHSVVWDHLIGDLLENTVTLVDEFSGRDTLWVPATVLLAGYDLEAA